MRFGLVALIVTAGFAMAGCADLGRATRLTPAPVDPTSAVADEVLQASRKKTARPRFRDVPPAPTDVRPPESFRTAVTENLQARARLDAWVAANPPQAVGADADTEAFAAGQRARIPAGQREPLPEPAGSEDYAARLRALATPPPPPK